jgi:chemotaxis protein CheX
MTASQLERSLGADFVPGKADIASILSDVWTSFLGDAPEVVPVTTDAGPAGRYSATVSITGGWQGHVVISVTATGASALAAAFLDLEEPADPADCDVTDALGELVNMVGGNVKSLAPGPSALSLPLVVRGGEAAAPDTRVVSQVALYWRGETVVVTVLSAVARA